MSPRPVSHYLARFDDVSLVATMAVEPVDVPFDEEPDLHARALARPTPDCEQAAVPANELYQEGVAAGLALGRQELQRHEAICEERLAAARAQLLVEESLRLQDCIRASVACLGKNVAATVAEILRPFVMQSLRDKAVSQLREMIEAVLSMEDGPEIEISGPADLLEALKLTMPDQLRHVAWSAGDPDFKLVFGLTVMEARVRRWIESIAPPGERGR